MSDAQLPLDTVEGESNPSLQSRVHPGDAGMMASVRLEALGDGLPVDETASAPGVEAGERDPVPDAAVPSASAHALASDEAYDDFQPMLDLRFPDSASQVPSPLPGEVPPLTAEPFDPHLAAPSHQGLGATAFGLEPPAPLEADGSDQRLHSDMGGAPAAADIPVEISPIFSALDAAERAVEAAQQREPAPEPDAYETGILLPHAYLADSGEETVAPLEHLQILEPAIASPEADGNPDAVFTTESAVSPETPPDDPDAPPSAEEQTLPAELLQDAAARIAAEATATAAALENLKRLLVHNRSEPDIAALHNLLEASPEHAEPPPIPVYHPPARVPVTPPPMVEPPLATTPLSHFADDDLPPRRPVAAVGSFFAGFALSWVFGAVLYVFLTAG